MLRFNLETDLWLGEGILRKNGVSCGLGHRLGGLRPPRRCWLERFHGDWKQASIAVAKKVVGDRAKHGDDTWTPDGKLAGTFSS
jgi:hypothetical protein